MLNYREQLMLSPQANVVFWWEGENEGCLQDIISTVNQS